jgi:putative membrane protein
LGLAAPERLVSNRLIRRGSPMIRNFSDHAANERTFLAWVRTAIAVMAFGFLVERFDLFLQVARASMGVTVAHVASRRFAEAAGLALMIMGLVIVAVATARFLKTGKEIDDPEAHAGPGARTDVALAALLLLLGLALLAYLVLSLMGAG